ncbi:flagellar motor protein MotB [Methylobacterium sp. Leaf456]|uniref:OmpA family protein n=1 Tax=Methylobacterium sp. Leaf456 TaxID=1736382 RepID=UPI0006F93A66|nr:OmpA family protein [Methylobacterium sp. Leaf456]KQT59682.1 flagellar motor protein MotB [Methylobacterium sp. Leaf456]
MGRAAPILAACLAVALAGQARANPLTEVPGARPVEAEAPPPRDEAAERVEAGAANPSAPAIIRSLAPFADGNPGAPLAVAPGDGGPAVRVVSARSVDLTVFFAYDSARLTPEARIQLEPLGQALRAPVLAGHGFLIAGHTDAAGGLAYNRRLSLARARAVKAHLVEGYGIAPTRLRVHGWGPSRPKDSLAPLSRVNRRVEVSLIAPARTGALRFVLPAAMPCAGISDPRRSTSLDLDDFDAAPTPRPCAD